MTTEERRKDFKLRQRTQKRHLIAWARNENIREAREALDKLTGRVAFSGPSRNKVMEAIKAIRSSH